MRPKSPRYIAYMNVRLAMRIELIKSFPMILDLPGLRSSSEIFNHIASINENPR